MPARSKRSRWRTLLDCWPLLLTISLMAAAFTWYATSALIFLALLPVWYLLHRGALKSAPSRLIVALLWLTGFICHLFILGWIVETDPAKWSNVEGLPVIIAHAFFWVTAAFSFSIGWAVFGLAASRFRGNRLTTGLAVVILPAAFVVGEFTRAFVTSVLFWGTEALVGPYWNFGAFGFAAGGTPAVFASRWFGLYGLTFLVVTTSLLLYWLGTNRRRYGLAGLAAAAAVILLGYVAYRTPDGTATRAGIVHINGETPLNRTTVGVYTGTQSPPRDYDFLVLPEYSGLYTESAEADAQRTLESFVFQEPSEGLVIAAGYGQSSEGKRVGQIGYYVDSQPIATQQKQFLMPGGEYLPVLTESIVRASGSPVLLPRFEQERHVNPGRHPETPVAYQGRTYGTLSCSGILTPQFYARLTRGGAEILTNPTSLVIFRDSAMFAEQNKQMVRYQAVANARPFIQAARSARSYVVDHNGRFVLTSEEPLVIAGATVTSNRTKTLSAQLGEWPVMLLAVAGIVGWYIRQWTTDDRRRTT